MSAPPRENCQCQNCQCKNCQAVKEIIADVKQMTQTAREKKYPYTQTAEGITVSPEHYFRFLEEHGLQDRMVKESMREYMRLSNEEDGLPPGEGPQIDASQQIQLRSELVGMTRKQAKNVAKALKAKGINAELRLK